MNGANKDVRRLLALGLMSGTSLDGNDAALIETDGDGHVACGAALTVPYAAALRDRLRGALGGRGGSALEAALTRAHAAAVERLRAAAGPGAGRPDVIGFHGHTLLHQPRRGLSRRIGDGAQLARLTGIEVVDDFRRADLEAGGQGAPLAPVFHAAMSRRLPRPLAVLNLGGVANVTWIGDEDEAALLAFDSGPGNALIDDWVRAHTGSSLDRDGALAAAGHVDESALAALLDDPYFAHPPPKSLDRGDFDTDPVAHLSAADGAATLAAFTARAAARAARHFPAPVRRWVVTGGGRRNKTLMAMLRRTVPGEVVPAEAVGWNGDALEAQAFAYLAVRSLKGLPLSYPGTTGVASAQTGGVRHPPPAGGAPKAGAAPQD